MADSEKRSNKNNRRNEIAEAFVMLVTDDHISSMTLGAIEIATDPNQKAEARLKATELIFSYLVPKAKQDINLMSNGEKITAGLILYDPKKDV